MFQWTKAEKEDTRKLVQTINAAISEEPLPEERLNTIFNVWWPQLERELKSLPEPEKVVDVTRDPDEMISEILELCREYLPSINPPQPLFPSDLIDRLGMIRQMSDQTYSEPCTIIVKTTGGGEPKLFYNVIRAIEEKSGTLNMILKNGASAGISGVAGWEVVAPRRPPTD